MTAMRLQNLFHDMQAENMGCIVRSFRFSQGGKDGGRISLTVIGDSQLEQTVRDLSHQGDCDWPGVVMDTVVQQIFHCPGQQSLVCVEDGMFGFFGLRKFQLTGSSKWAFIELCRQFP